jgi:hypothetical protein
MLLCEIIKHPSNGLVADAKLAQKDFAIGCKVMKMDALNPEEFEAFKAIGIDPRQLKNVPIAYGYELPFGGGTNSTTPEMDALKMRKGWDRAGAEPDITTGMTYFARRLYGDTDPTSTGTIKRYKTVKDDIISIQRILRSPRPKTLVVVPSSSELPMMLANILADVLRENGQQCTILDKGTLEKTHPKISQGRIDALGLDASKITDYAGIHDRLEEIARRLAELNPSTNEYTKLRKEYDKLKAVGTFQIKKHMGPGSGKSDFGKVYYGWIKAHEHDISTDVVIIDDNVVSGRTVGEAAKELIRVHRKPLNICGIALHMFITRVKRVAPPPEYDREGYRINGRPEPTRKRTLDVAGAVEAGVLSASEFEQAKAQATAGMSDILAKVRSTANYQLTDAEKQIVGRASAFNRDVKELTPMRFAAKYDMPTYQPLNTRVRNK